MATVATRREEQVLLITLDRPKANAIDAATSVALYQAFVELDSSADLRAGVIVGAGDRFFSAGWDLKAAAEGEAHDADHGPGGFAGLTEFFTLSKPVVAAINGSAYGGGVELALAAHLAVAAEDAVFSFPEARLGILPDAGGITRLAARIPRAVALELLLTGRTFSAAEALQWGLVNRVVPQADVLAEAMTLAQSISKAAPLSVAAILEATARTQGLSDSQAFDAMRTGIPAVQRVAHSIDATEGARAFAERRPPHWQGR